MLTLEQIEQFIESIFPSQKKPIAESNAPVDPAQLAREKQDAEEAKWDMIYMGAAVVITLFVITSSMVSGSSLFDGVPADICRFSLPGAWELDSISLSTTSKRNWEICSALAQKL